MGDVMGALYEARLEDLGPGDLVRVECACGHTELLTPSMLATAGVKPYESILDFSSSCAVESATCAAGWWFRSGGQALTE
jgi:hypothetical protein